MNEVYESLTFKDKWRSSSCLSKWVFIINCASMIELRWFILKFKELIKHFIVIINYTTIFIL